MKTEEADVDPLVAQWISEYGEDVVLRTWGVAQSEANYLAYEPVPKLRAFHSAPEKVAVVIGANRSSKTYTASHDLIGNCTNVWPDSLRELTQKRWKPKKTWVITLDYPTLQEAIQEYIQKIVPEHWIDTWVPSKHILRWRNLMDPSQPGSITTFRSADAGATKLASAAVDYAWMDEEPKWDVFHQVYTRTISTKGKLRMTFTPENGFSWSYKKLYSRRHEPAVAKWLRVFEVTMYDNPHLDPEEIALAEEVFDDDVVYRVRILGQYAEMSGEMVFNSSALSRARAAITRPIRSGHALEIWENPKQGMRYLIGADVASGVRDGDYSVAVVLNLSTWSVAALLRMRCQPDEFADHLFNLGKAYQNCEIAVERQNHGTSTLICLRNRGYTNLYCHASDDRVSPDTPSNLLGWDTNERTKDEAINALREYIGTKNRQSKIRISSETILDEMSTFIYYTSDIPEGRSRHKILGRCGAKYGCHDDTVMALAIAVRIAQKRSTTYTMGPDSEPLDTWGAVLRDLEKSWPGDKDDLRAHPLKVKSDHLRVAGNLRI